MKKLFIQFYLLLFVCFVVMTVLVGLVYKFTAERVGRESMNDLMKSSLYLMRSELREIPPRNWNSTIQKLDLNLSFRLHIEPIHKYQLDPVSMKHLRNGSIVVLDDEYTFLQRIPRSHYVLSVGPIPYLFFLHQMKLFDISLMFIIGISLALPVFIWMRPHWRDLLRLEQAAQRFGQGHLNERVCVNDTSSLVRLNQAFNQMADNINAVVTSKKQLIDGIAHELRTPLVRLRYRLELVDNIKDDISQALNRDIGQLEGLIEELLTYARLDRPHVELHFEQINLTHWIKTKLEDFRLINPGYRILLEIPYRNNIIVTDTKLLERALDNIVNNGLRYAKHQLSIKLWVGELNAVIQVDDDGPGIPPEERQRVLEPFVRLDQSRDRATGGCGLGLAIVKTIALTFGGEVTINNSSLGGTSIRFCWPIKKCYSDNQ